MSVLQRLASFQNKRDNVPNQELAIDLVKKNDREGIREIAENLNNPDKKIQSDCIKVLYETGYIKPELISDYADVFIGLLKSINNRLVWGGMIALSTVASIKPKTVFNNLDEIMDAIEKGSAITRDSGIKALALAASSDESGHSKIFPLLMNHLLTCRPKEIPMHAEYIMPAVKKNNRSEFVDILRARIKLLKPSQFKRIKKILNSFSPVTA